MNIKEIISNLYYVGVDDRTTTRFEGLWPLPKGVSYNSYIVVGSEKVALIDTVEVSEVYDFLANIRSIIGDRKIDYLIVNHMEPDHSGGIRTILAEYPDIKIVTNQAAVNMIKNYYGITDPEQFNIIKENDKIDLGGRTLAFAMIPMVHWPETMVTYVVEDAVLFSGDAFGTFGALNGAVTDDETDVEPYFEEMYRYYSNIVGKYGAAVQRALGKLQGLKLDYICPTHGPVWHSCIGRAVEITDRLSRYESEEGVTIVYGSMYGNTARVADRIAAGLASRGIKKIRMYDASYADLSYMISDAFRYKALIVGAPTYSMTVFPPVDQFLTAMQTREVKNKVFASFGSHTWASAAAKRIAAWAETVGLEHLAAMDMKCAPGETTSDDIDAIVDAVAKGLGH